MIDYFHGMNNPSKELSKNIRVLRKQHGWTQTDLSKKLGCSQETITLYEKNIRKPSADLIPIIAKIFGVSVDQLYNLKENLQSTGKDKNPKLWKKFEQIEQLPPSDKRAVFKMVDGLLTQRRQATR
ncbi:MAG TPA: hypothetical protein DCO75_04550 [Fibrobacteres bacterium]|jgi:transcriptional regulator with XRE-family HTH domain|nr:hypothetical protein [Fibrobacterota bacterium]